MVSFPLTKEGAREGRLILTGAGVSDSDDSRGGLMTERERARGAVCKPSTGGATLPARVISKEKLQQRREETHKGLRCWTWCA